MNLCSVSGKPTTGTDARLAEKRRKDELSKLLAILVEYSKIMPFKWYANKYMCFYCCCPFLDSASLKQHTKEEHCGPKLPSLLRAVVGHSRIKLDISELKLCAKCNKPIGTLDETIQHIQSHGVDVDEQVSSQLFAFRLSDDGMSCVECGQRFRFFGPLLAHSHRLHNKTASFLCEICGQGFVAKANVDSHVRSVHAVRRARSHREQLRCPKCPEVLRSRYLRKRHLALVHDVKSAQFACAECPKVFTEMSTLVQHNARVHLRERAFACDVCGFRVFSGDLLRRHMVRHDDSRPHQCEFCKKSFQRKKTLDFHRRIHTNDRRYACKECGKAFVQVTSLKLHMRVHHGPSDTK